MLISRSRLRPGLKRAFGRRRSRTEWIERGATSDLHLWRTIAALADCCLTGQWVAGEEGRVAEIWIDWDRLLPEKETVEFKRFEVNLTEE